ncbi:MAG: ATP-dependent helicase/nuclease subunit [Myxococcales bacterium]|nr:ATP-dependent helicase/nuclease subunit [Myxococcales bacterium]
MSTSELLVVPGERHVERLAREGERAETRTSLRSRLAAALLPDTAFVDPRECRLVLAMALAEGENVAASAGQLDLFGGVTAVAASGRTSPPDPRGDAILATARARGGPSWARLVAALDDAIALLRARGATAAHLEGVARSKGFLAARARMLAAAMRAVDARLARAAAVDGRLVGTLLSEAIAATSADDLERVIGARRLRARWILAWEPSDVSWWRALDDKLVPHGGGARVVLPTFDRPLAGGRERDPLDTLADEVTRGLDAPTESETIAPVLGDLTGVTAPEGSGLVDVSRVRIVGASDAVAQARAVATVVSDALASGAAVERIAIAFPVMDERTLAPLRRALEDEGIVGHEARGAPASSAPVVSAALLALDAATSLDRHVVARLLRSGWIDAARLTGEGRRDSERRLGKLARALETSATAAGADPVERLIRTATSRPGGGRAWRTNELDAAEDEARDLALATRIANVLSGSRAASTRIEHVRAARTLWSELGIGARAGRGGLSSFLSDAAPTGVPRAERLAIARDARAWDALVAALELHETTANRVGALEQAIDAGAFRLELLELLDAAASQPGAARVAAVRIARLVDVAGDALDLLVVVDVNEGLLPRDDTHDALVSEALAEAIGRASHGAFIAPTAGASRARDLSALAVAAADARSVVLTFSREDGAGAPLAPSPVIDALERAGVPVIASEPPPARLSGLDVTLRVTREREREGFFLDPERPRSDVVADLAPTSTAARLLVGETGGAGRALAVTGLERFARCAFMGYAHVVLAARETDLKDELPDAREEGTLVHEVLAAAFVATRDLWLRRPRPAAEILERGLAAAEDVLERWQGHAPLRAIVRLRVSDAVRAVLGLAIADDTWDFVLAEQAFGGRGDNAWKALDLADTDVTLSLRGTIDRVDRAHDGRMLRVVDYKRSKTTVRDAGSSLGETALQVPVYACVAGRELALPATGVYVPTQARDVAVEAKPNARAAQRMDELLARPTGAGLNEIEHRALAIVMSARSGALAPIPAHESECRYCAVSGGCRKPRFAMAPVDDADDDRDPAGRPSRDTT